MTIGEKIKQLRKQNDITQEKLADYLNISYQAISKWENNTACPDISMIVPLANFFGVTTDVLFCRDEEEQKKEIEEIENEVMRLANLGYVKERIPLCRSAVIKYPKSYRCLINLAYALINSKWSKGFEQDEIDSYLGEAIEICERVLEDCTETEYRSSATQTLVMIYGDKQSKFYDEEKAVNYAFKQASMTVSRELLLVHAYGTITEKAAEQRHRNNVSFMDLLSQNITFENYSSDEEFIFALNTMLNILNSFFYDGNFLFFHCRIAEIYRCLATSYAKLNDNKKAIEALYSAKKHALAYENIPDGEQNYTSIFICKTSHNNANTSKNFTCSELDLVRDILKNNAFDGMRDTSEFKEFEQSISD